MLSNAANKVDTSLQANWTTTKQEKYHFEISAWPANGDWSQHKDGARFAAGKIIATSMGLKTVPTLVPTLSLSATYQLSLFGDGPGKYTSAERILAAKLASANQGDLNAILRDGIGGFSTDQALAIGEASAMRRFCGQMRTLFAQFLTDDDALAARYSVLKGRTQFMGSSELRKADNCVQAGEEGRLLQLSSTFTVDDLSRKDPRVRTEFVHARVSALAAPLLSNSKEALLGVVDDIKTFRFDVQLVQNVFPARTDGKSWGGLTGQAAFDQLREAGGFRLGCAQAAPGQSIQHIAGVVLGKSTNKSAALFMEFSNADPSPDADPKKETAKVKKLTFYPIDMVQQLLNLDGWPGPDCPLN